jgi:hypothetical protein
MNRMNEMAQSAHPTTSFSAGATFVQKHVFDAFMEAPGHKGQSVIELFHGYTYSGQPLATIVARIASGVGSASLCGCPPRACSAALARRANLPPSTDLKPPRPPHTPLSALLARSRQQCLGHAVVYDLWGQIKLTFAWALDQPVPRGLTDPTGPVQGD